MAVLGTTYPLPRSGGLCAVTERPFAVGETFVAALVDEQGPHGTSRLVRVDVCAKAWDEGKRPAGELFGFWKATFAAEKPAKQALLDDDQLLDMFDATPSFEPSVSGEGAQPDAKQVRFRYLLTLLLVRRKQLRVIATKLSRDGTILHVLRKGEQAGTQPTLVLDPKLDDLAIVEALDQFGAVLAGDPEGK
jgi:hypothetical protein